MIRIDAVWLSVEPLDMRAGTDTALTRVVRVFGEARAHHAYVFANRLTLPRFHVHQIVGNFLMNGERNGQEGVGSEPAVHE